MASRSTHPRDQRLTWLGDACLLPELHMVGWDAPREAGNPGLGAHQHRGMFEICYIVSGRVEWWVRRGSRTRRPDVFVVEPGHVFLTRPNEEHGGVDSMLHPCELYWIQVRLGPGDRKAARSLSQGRRTFRGGEPIRSAFERIVSEHAHRDRWSANAARAALHELIALICRAQDTDDAGNEGGAVSPAIRDAMNWMVGHLAEHFGLPDVAEVAGLSLGQFLLRFRREVGYTPADWRTRQRLALAKRILLDDRDRSILDIALASGFATSQYFATAFKRIVGISPRAFRRQHVAGSRRTTAATTAGSARAPVRRR